MIHPRVQLVTAEVVATMRGISRENVYELVDGGTDTFMWVFNVGQGNKRELRFWTRELREPVAVRDFHLDEVVRQIVPRRDLVPGQFCGMPNWELVDLLRLTRPALMDLRDELCGEARSGGIYYPRPAIEDFFRRRWLFAGVLAETK